MKWSRPLGRRTDSTARFVRNCQIDSASRGDVLQLGATAIGEHLEGLAAAMGE
jgi:hypothetical protein